MTPTQARRMAQQLSGEGMKQTEIGQRLFEAGYVSKRGKGPLTGPGMSYLLTKGVRRRKAKRGTKATLDAVGPKAKRGTKATLDAVGKILELPDMSANDRIALLQLILGL